VCCHESGKARPGLPSAYRECLLTHCYKLTVEMTQ
jgi:hypothetical protein